MEAVRQFVRVLDGIVEIFEGEGRPDPEEQTEDEGQQEVLGDTRLERVERRRGPVDDLDVGDGGAEGRLDLLGALQQALVDRFVGLDLALEDSVLRRLLFQVEGLFLLGIGTRLQILSRSSGPSHSCF